MKKHINVLFIVSIFLLMISLLGCGSVQQTQYVPPTYKTTDNVIGIVKLDDARPAEKLGSDAGSADAASKAILEVAKSSSAFREVRFTDKNDKNCNLLFTGTITHYNVDYSMTTLTWLPNALIVGIGVGAAIAIDDKDATTPIILGSLGIACLDFLVNGLLGKRQYDHDYKLEVAYKVSDQKNNFVLMEDTTGYILTLRFTHFQLYFGGGGMSRTDVDAITTYAYDYIARVTAENIIDAVAKKLGSERLIGLEDGNNTYPLKNRIQIGNIECEFDIKKIL